MGMRFQNPKLIDLENSINEEVKCKLLVRYQIQGRDNVKILTTTVSSKSVQKFVAATSS